MSTSDYYQILGVDEDASQEEIKTAFREQAMECHPDQSDMEDDKAKARFIELREAFDVLGDPGKRKKYDKGRSADTVSTRDEEAYSGDWENFSDDPEVTIGGIVEIVMRGAADAAKQTLSAWSRMIRYGFSYGLLLAVPCGIFIYYRLEELAPYTIPESFTTLSAVVLGAGWGIVLGGGWGLVAHFKQHNY